MRSFFPHKWDTTRRGHSDTNTTLSEQPRNTSLQKKCALCVHKDLPEFTRASRVDMSVFLELNQVIQAWPSLPDPVKKGIMAMVKATLASGRSVVEYSGSG